MCIPTTSGTGSEVTPFSVVTDERDGSKYPLADYALTPTMAIVDPQLVLNIPKKLTAWGGIDALTHALESYVSIFATGEPRASSGSDGEARPLWLGSSACASCSSRPGGALAHAPWGG